MKRSRYFHLALCLLLLSIVLWRFAYAITPPASQSAGLSFDPRPLLQQADPNAEGAYTFAVFGDSYANPELTPLLKMVAGKQPTFVVTTGDMVSNGSNLETWRKLSDRAGWFMQKISTWPVIGNHELDGHRVGAKTFEEFYNVPSGNYSFTFRNSKFIILGHTGAAPKDQLDYLSRELTNRQQYQHIFVFRHSPFYTVGSKSRGEVSNKPTALTKLIAQHHVTAVFSGHDHSYYHTRRDGVNYFTAAHAGAGVYPLKRLSERLPDDAYMGLSTDGKFYLLHTPTIPDRRALRTGGSSAKWTFAIFVHVDGSQMHGEVISSRGEVWDRFEL